MKKFFALAFIFTIINNNSLASCYEATIMKPSPFMGNSGEIFQLDDGTYWEVGLEYEYLYEYYPKVLVCPSRGFIAVDGEKLSVTKLK
tara:strand:+ start:180 stop:443 length:264 start_codon:yes stop_codon:yes gene_type:complete